MADYRLRTYRMYRNGLATERYIVATMHEVEIINTEIEEEGREYRLEENGRAENNHTDNRG